MNTEPVQISSTLNQSLVQVPVQEKRKGRLTRWQEKNRDKRAQAVSDGERFNLFVYLIWNFYWNTETESRGAATNANSVDLALTTLGLVFLPIAFPLKWAWLAVWWLITAIPKIPGKILNRIWYGD